MDREEVRGATTADAHMQPETKRDEASRASANRRRECARASAGCGSAPAPTGPPAPVPPACAPSREARDLCQCRSIKRDMCLEVYASRGRRGLVA